ncbi:MAG: hypothetical protein V1740_06435 [Candidatus Woesearchaeota archaeon]
MIILIEFGIKNFDYVKEGNPISGYKLSSDYIEDNKLMSDCYVSDSRMEFTAHIKNCVIYPSFNNYDIVRVIGYNAHYSVVKIDGAEIPDYYALIKEFEGFEGTIGLFSIDTEYLISDVFNNSGKVSGTVLDEKGIPLENSIIRVYLENKLSFESRSGKDGKFIFYIPKDYDSNKIVLSVEKWGRKPMNLVMKDHQIPLKIIMKRNSFLRNGVSVSSW